MKKFNIEIELTDNEINFLKELILDDDNVCEIPDDTIDIVGSLENKGLLIEGSYMTEGSLVMTENGLYILNLLK